MQIVSVMIRADDGSEFEVPLKTALELFEALKSIMAPEEKVAEVEGLDEELLKKLKEQPHQPPINIPYVDAPFIVSPNTTPIPWSVPAETPVYVGGTISPTSVPPYPNYTTTNGTEFRTSKEMYADPHKIISKDVSWDLNNYHVSGDCIKKTLDDISVYGKNKCVDSSE